MARSGQVAINRQAVIDGQMATDGGKEEENDTEEKRAPNNHWCRKVSVLGEGGVNGLGFDCRVLTKTPFQRQCQ